MSALDQVIQMKEKGLSEDQIISYLQQQGVSPKQINDALNQYNVKSAVSGNNQAPQPEEEYPQAEYEDQQQSININEEAYENYPPQEYPQAEYGEYSQEDSSDTMIEIAEQVFSEKNKKIKTKLDELVEFKSLTQIKVDHALERIKRIETVIDKLQISILDKVGSYGKTLESMRKEMGMMQETFGKVLPKIVEKKEHSTKKK